MRDGSAPRSDPRGPTTSPSHHSPTWLRRLARFTALAATVGLAGCGGSDKPVDYADVSGTVTYNGKPIEKGTITFSIPGLPPTPMNIVDGKYSGQAMVGSNHVVITAYRKAAQERPLPAEGADRIKAGQALAKSGGGGLSEAADPTMEDYIPPEYGRESTQTRKVERGGANKFDFDLKGP